MSNISLTQALPRLINSVPRSRSLEAVLLFWVAGMHAFQLAQIQLSVTDSLDEQILLYWTPLFIASYVVHFVLRFKAKAADSLLLPLTTLLNGLGISMIYRLDLAEVARGNEQMLGARQVWLTVLAMLVAAGFIWVLKNHMVLKKYTYIAMAVGILLLLTPMLPVIGREINGARLWISIADQSFQPGEIAKLALIVFFAGYLTKHRESLSLIGKKIFRVRIPRARDLGPLLLVWFASLGVLVLQRDLGTSLLYFGIFLGLLYVATGRGFYAGIGIGMIITAGLIASQLLSYVGNRFDAWLNPFVSENYSGVGGSYQLVQGLFGMAHGGILGTGLGGGYPQLVPLAANDFIFAAIAEELGLVGVFAVLSIYLLITYRGLRIAMAHRDDFSRLLAAGLSFVIALQVFIVVGGVLRVVPLTGLTTPFLAAGGSSLLANWLLIALLLRISDSTNKQVVSE